MVVALPQSIFRAAPAGGGRDRPREVDAAERPHAFGRDERGAAAIQRRERARRHKRADASFDDPQRRSRRPDEAGDVFGQAACLRECEPHLFGGLERTRKRDELAPSGRWGANGSG
jgi:hypothetical protein